MINHEVSNKIFEEREMQKSRFLNTLKLMNDTSIIKKMEKYSLDSEKIQEYSTNTTIFTTSAGEGYYSTNRQSGSVNKSQPRNLFKSKIRQKLFSGMQSPFTIFLEFLFSETI
jgi:hypothetical protein